MAEYQTLRLLKESEEGFGVICEWNTSKGPSGFISLDLQSNTILKEFEEKNNKDVNSVFMNCILQKCDTENKNGRYYPKHVLEREDQKYQQLIVEGRAEGEANHPDASIIDVKNCSHRVVKTWWEGNTLMGVLEIMTSPGYHKHGIISCAGDIIADKLRRGVKMGISSRGVGSLKMIQGKNTVQDDFELICYDLVHSPSTPGAFLYPGETKINESIDKNNTKTIQKSKIIKGLDDFLL